MQEVEPAPTCIEHLTNKRQLYENFKTFHIHHIGLYYIGLSTIL